MKNKNFREIPEYIRQKLNTSKYISCIVGSTEKINKKNVNKFENLGIKFENNKLVLPKKSIIPDIKNGRYSKYNFLGRNIIRRDLGKTTKMQFYRCTDWHGQEHTGYYPRSVWVREVLDAPSYVLEFELMAENNEEYIVKFTVGGILDISSANFESELLFKCNLLQENVGSCDIFDLNARNEEILKSYIVDWEIFPPGSIDAQSIYETLPEGINKPSFTEFTERYNVIMELKPKEIFRGRGQFNKYFGVKLNSGKVIFENIFTGNALYVVHSNWEKISKTPRSILMKLDNDKDFERIIHNKYWKQHLYKAIE